ncbi:MAG: YbaK/EbsC family protein [Chloroflexi bacterium]|jgi:prolyl-tRNA editing enzyme YbaK/EbsC (Cys-tRNA(Pro) deacylase)|nr:YbaK/EbsC family protein [Chloroflexota bacterium]
MTAQRTPADVQAALDAAGLAIRVRVMEGSTATAQQAADSIGTDLGSIVKSLCFLVDGQAVLVLAAGDRTVDDRKLAGHYGVSRKKVRIADADTTIAVTGYAPGGVPPLGHARPLPVLIDASLGRFATVYAAGGSPRTIFPISFALLVEATGGQVLELAKG